MLACLLADNLYYRGYRVDKLVLLYKLLDDALHCVEELKIFISFLYQLIKHIRLLLDLVYQLRDTIGGYSIFLGNIFVHMVVNEYQ